LRGGALEEGGGEDAQVGGAGQQPDDDLARGCRQLLEVVQAQQHALPARQPTANLIMATTATSKMIQRNPE